MNNHYILVLRTRISVMISDAWAYLVLGNLHHPKTFQLCTSQFRMNNDGYKSILHLFLLLLVTNYSVVTCVQMENDSAMTQVQMENDIAITIGIMLQFYTSTQCFDSKLNLHVSLRLSTKWKSLVKEGTNYKLGNSWAVDHHNCSSPQKMEIDRQGGIEDKREEESRWNGWSWREEVN